MKPGAPVYAGPVAEVLRARCFELVDEKGKVRAEIRISDDDSARDTDSRGVTVGSRAQLRMLSPSGEYELILEMDNGGPCLFLGQEGKNTPLLATLDDGGLSLALDGVPGIDTDAWGSRPPVSPHAPDLERVMDGHECTEDCEPPPVTHVTSDGAAARARGRATLHTISEIEDVLGDWASRLWDHVNGDVWPVAHGLDAQRQMAFEDHVRALLGEEAWRALVEEHGLNRADLAGAWDQFLLRVGLILGAAAQYRSIVGRDNYSDSSWVLNEVDVISAIAAAARSVDAEYLQPKP